MQTSLPCERRTPPAFRRLSMDAPSVGVHKFEVRFRDGIFFHHDPEQLVLDVPNARLTVGLHEFKFHCLEVSVGFFAHDTTLRDTSTNKLVTIRAHRDIDTFNILRAHLCFIAHAPMGYVPVSLRRPYGRTSVIIGAFQQTAPKNRVVLKHTRRTDLHYLGMPTQEFLAGRKAIKDLPAHPNVARILATRRTSDALVTVLPMTTGVFADLLSGPKPDDYTLLSVAHDLLAGIAHMHANGVVHRNICLENILIDGETSPKAVICGFSQACRFEDLGSLSNSLQHKTISRTPPANFCAPELFPKPEHVAKTASDVWSVGIVLFLLFLRRYPWGRAHEKQLSGRRQQMFAILDEAAKNNQNHWERLGVRADLEAALPVGVKSLLSGLLQPIPSRRLTARAALEHPCFAVLQDHLLADNRQESLEDADELLESNENHPLVRQGSTVRVASSVLFKTIARKIRVTKCAIDLWAQKSGVQLSNADSDSSIDSQ